MSRLYQVRDVEGERFRTRRLAGPHPYIWLDAPCIQVPAHGRVVSMTVMIAIGAQATGEWKALGLDGSPSEDGACWLGVLRRLVALGLSGVGPSPQRTGWRRRPVFVQPASRGTRVHWLPLPLPALGGADGRGRRERVGVPNLPAG